MAPSRPRLAILGAVVGLLSFPLPGSATTPAGAEETTAGPDAEIRGLEQPLRRPPTPVRSAARAVLSVPWAVVAAASLPVEGLAWADEKHHLATRLASLVTFRVGDYRARVGPLFGYATSTGFSPLGATVGHDDWLGLGLRFRAAGGWLNDRENLAALRLERGGGGWTTRVGARASRVADLPFYGIGPGSPDSRLGADHREELLEGEVELRPIGSLSVSIAGWRRNRESRAPEAGRPVSLAFPEVAAAAERADYSSAEIGLAWDRRDRGPFSTRGFLVRAAGGVNRAESPDDPDFRHWGLEAQRFQDLWRGSRVLALRASLRGVDADDGAIVPYPELESLGGSDGPRGYSRHRFTDRISLVLTAEYRYRVTQRFEGRVLADWGTVAEAVERLRLADVGPTFGLGLAIPSPRFPVVIEASAGEEGTEIRFGFGSLFAGDPRRGRD